MRFTDISIFSIDSGDSDYAVRENYGNKGLCIVVRRTQQRVNSVFLWKKERNGHQERRIIIKNKKSLNTRTSSLKICPSDNDAAFYVFASFKIMDKSRGGVLRRML